jgi:hypothetical protein
MRARYVAHVQLLDAREHLSADHVDEPANGKAPTDCWSEGQLVVAYALYLAVMMQSGN